MKWKSHVVVNLYPSLPLKEATTVILLYWSCDAELKRRTKLNINEIKLLIDLCLSKCYFYRVGYRKKIDSG